MYRVYKAIKAAEKKTGGDEPDVVITIKETVEVEVLNDEEGKGPGDGSEKGEAGKSGDGDGSKSA